MRRAAACVCWVLLAASAATVRWYGTAYYLSRDRILLARRSLVGDFIPKPYRDRLLSQPVWLTPGVLRDSVNRPDVGEMDFPITMQQIESFEERFREKAVLRLTAGLFVLLLSAVAVARLRRRPGSATG